MKSEHAVSRFGAFCLWASLNHGISFDKRRMMHARRGAKHRLSRARRRLDKEVIREERDGQT